MVGSLFAGREESPGDVVRRRGQLFKVYRGMASRSAAAARLAIEGRGDALDQYVAEGEEMEFPLRGSVAEIVEELHGGLRSGMSYVDAATIPEFWEKASFIRQTEAGERESHPGRHDDAVPQRRHRHDGRRRQRARGRLAARRRDDDRGRRWRRRATGRREGRPEGRRRHAGPRQHAPPPLPDAHARPGPGGRPLHLAARALPRLVADRRRVGVRGRPHRPRRARALGLHDRLRPSLRVPEGPRGPDRGRGAGGARDRRADRRLARLDGPRRVGRRPAARRARGGARRRARRDRAARGAATRAGPRRTRAARGRAVLALLGHGTPDGGVGRARPPARAPAPHAPRRDARGGGVLPRALRLPARRVPRPAGLARRRRLVRALRAPLRAGHRAVREHGHRGRPLPHLQPAPRGRRRAGARHGRRRRSCRPRRRRLRLERAQRPLLRGQAGAARRAWARRRTGHDSA